MTLPLAAQDLTDEWLTGALRAGGTLAADTRIQVLAIEPVTTGAASHTVRVRAELHGVHGPTTLRLIAKLPTTNADIARANRLAGWSMHESNFYRGSALDFAVPTPRCYFSLVDANGQAVLLLEDLSGDANLTAGDIDAGCSRHQAEGVLRVLAELHRRSATLRGAPTTWPPPFMHLASRRQGPDPRAARWASWRAARGDDVRYRAQRVGDLLARDGAPAFRRVAETSPVLLHGDCKADNMFFRHDGEPVLFDWQLVSRGAGAFDVAFFLSTSVTSELRRDLEATALRAYHAAAAVTLAYDAWFDLYRHCINVGFYRTATSISLHNSGKASARSLLDTVGERQAAAIDDLETDELESST